MRKIIFVFTMVTAIGIICGCKESSQNMMAEELVKPATPKNLKGIYNTDLPESKAEYEPFTPKGAPESLPGILFILNNDPGQSAWSPALWWSYQHTNTGLPGC